jgi:hypothetical protein
MTKEITTTNNQNFEVLDPNSEMGEALAHKGDLNLDSMVKVTCPAGGGTVFSWDDFDGSTNATSIDGVLVGFQKSWTLWPTLESGNEAPVLVSYDGIKGYLTGTGFFGDIDFDVLMQHKNEDGSISLLTLPYASRGSRGERGTRISRGATLYVLPEGRMLPLAVKIPGMSLRNIQRTWDNLRCVPWKAIISLTLTKEKNAAGTAYSQIHMSQVGTLGSESAEIAKAIYWDSIKNANIQLEKNAAAVSLPQAEG